jgi:hypothetical protein
MSNELGLKVKPVTGIAPEDETRVAAWINTEDYKLKNFVRQALVRNSTCCIMHFASTSWRDSIPASSGLNSIAALAIPTTITRSESSIDASASCA